MATKRDLGVSYLLGSGLGLIATLTWFYLSIDTFDLGLFIATVTAGVLSGTFVFIGYWMYSTGIAGDTVWTVAKWSSLGLSIPVVVGVVILRLSPNFLLGAVVPGIFINLVAVGGVIGLLLGLVLEMHREQSDLRQLNQRNRVLNRVLRHNIRNDMSVMQLHVDMLDDELEGDANGSIVALRRKIEEVVSTSDMARRIDELHSDSLDEGPIDVIDLIENRIRIIESTHPDVTIQLDLPDRAWADVGTVFDSVIDNIVENAIKHHDDAPSIEVTVEPPNGSGDKVRIIIADDGPGIPDAEIEMLESGDETQLEHATGLGLWLVEWIISHYDGDIHFETDNSKGTRAIIDIPAAPDRKRVFS